MKTIHFVVDDYWDIIYWLRENPCERTRMKTSHDDDHHLLHSITFAHDQDAVLFALVWSDNIAVPAFDNSGD